MIKNQQRKMVEQARSADRWAISRYLEEVKFAPRLMGVDQADVWKKIEKLCELYENALTEERGRAEKLACLLNACRAKGKADAAEEKNAEEVRSDG